MTENNRKEAIKQLLKKIYKNEKKVKSKMSKQIIALREYLKSQIYLFNEIEIEYLFLGEPN